MTNSAQEPMSESEPERHGHEPATVAEPPRGGRLARLRGRWQEPVILLALLLFFLWIRLLTLEPIEIGGDAIQKWFFVRRWAFSSPFEGTVWNHHLTRMGDNLPVYLIQRLFGTSPPVYYVGPLLAFLVTGFTLYALGKRMSGRLLGVLAAVALTLFGPMRRAASQMVPSVFSAMYITLGAYCLLRYASGEPRERRRWLLGTAASIFGAYLSHEPNLYFLPAFVLIVWIFGKRWQDLLLLLGVLLGLFLVETAIYASFTEHLSRLHITMLTHGSRGSIKIDGFWGLLGRYDSPDFGQDFRRYFYFFPFAALGVAFLGRTRFEKLVPLLPFTFLFLMTFLVRGIDPIRTWTSFQSRYLVAAVPLITLTNVLFLLRVVGLVGRWLGRALNGSWSAALRRRSTLVSERVGPGLRHDVVWIVALLLLLGARAYPDEGLAAKIARHPLMTWRETAAVISDAYRRHLPIVGPKKVVTLAYFVYIDDETLLEDGKLPPIGDKIRVLESGKMWLSIDPRAYEADVRRKRAGKVGGKACWLELRRNQRFMRPVRKTVLPASCHAVPSSV